MKKSMTGEDGQPALTIGIDASRANAARRTGVERYGYRLIQELKSVIPADYRVILYSEDSLRGDLGDLPDNWESRVLKWPHRYFWAELRLGWEILRHPPDLLFQPGRALPLVLPRRTLATLHDVGFMARPDAYGFLNRWYQNLTTRLYLLRSRVVTVSEFTSRELRRCFGQPRHGVASIPLGVDGDLYRAAADDPAGQRRVLAGHSLEPGYFLCVGRLEDKKNIAGALGSYEMLTLLLKGETPPLVLVGSKGRGADEALARLSPAAREKVRLLGFVHDADLPYLYAGSLALFFPSLYEGFGLPVLEAFAARVPVVCSDNSSLPEVAGQAAAYVNPGVNQEMAEMLLRIVRDADLRRSLVERGSARLAEYTWRRVAERTWDEMRRLLEEMRT